MTLTEFIVLSSVISMVHGNGLLLLYRPKDITSECAFSRHLRFDISFGMGMSDTITLVFRTLNDVDYECVVEIVASSPQYLIAVIRYPTTILRNCAVNRDALIVLKRWRCTRLCDLINGEVYSPYLTFTVLSRLRFLFKSNSSINTDINANFYQVTITSARKAPSRGCNRKNETICTIGLQNYCFTTGVVCDGIKNCGVDDWFDERKSQCTLPEQKLSYAPIVAVVAAMLCTVVAGVHALLRLLPPHANSFFVFNANEDNRLCIDPVIVPRGTASNFDTFKRVSIIPVFGSMSLDIDINTCDSQVTMEKEENPYDLEDDLEAEQNKVVVASESHLAVSEEKPVSNRKSTMKYMTEKLQKFMSIRHATSDVVPSRKTRQTFVV